MLATLCAMFANANRSPKSQPVKAEDFMLQFVAHDQASQAARLFDTLRAIAKPGKPPKRRKRLRT